MIDIQDVYERKNSIFLLACPPKAVSASGRRLRIQKHIIKRVINQFQKFANVEPYLVGMDKWFADMANLLIDIKTDKGLPDMILSTWSCWKGDSIFLLADNRYDNKFIKSLTDMVSPNTIAFYETNGTGNDALVGIGVHHKALDVFHRCIVMAQTENKLTLNGIYAIFDTYRELIHTEHDISLVMREAVLHTKQVRQYNK